MSLIPGIVVRSWARAWDRLQCFSHRSVHVAEGCLERRDDVEVQLEHRPVVRRYAAAQCLDELRVLLPGRTLRQAGQSFRVLYTCNESFQDFSIVLLGLPALGYRPGCSQGPGSDF